MERWTWGNILSNNFQNQYQNGVKEVSTDAGKPFRRLMWNDIGDIMQGSFILEKNAYLDFMSWYKFNLRQGTLPFTYYDCRYEVDRTARFVDQVPTYVTNSNKYNVTCKIIFDNSTINSPRYLLVNDGLGLIVNGDKQLIVNKKLRI